MDTKAIRRFLLLLALSLAAPAWSAEFSTLPATHDLSLALDPQDASVVLIRLPGSWPIKTRSHLVYREGESGETRSFEVRGQRLLRLRLRSSLSRYSVQVLGQTAGGQWLRTLQEHFRALDLPGFLHRPAQEKPAVAAAKVLVRNDWQVELAVDAGAFPDLDVIADIQAQGLPFDGGPEHHPLLAAANFVLDEDARRQNLLHVQIPDEAAAARRLVDVVFVHDDSGSLDDEAAQVKANIQAFLDQLAAQQFDFRVGLLPYGGGGGFSDPGGRLLNDGNLTSDPAVLIAQIDQMRFDGGNERAFDGLDLAARATHWRSSAQRVLILITDEDNDRGAVDEASLIGTLRAQNLSVYGLTAGHQEYGRIAAATNGRVFDIRSDFSSILQEIGADIAARYVLNYRSDNPSLDGSLRTLDMTIAGVDRDGEAFNESFSTQFQVAAPLQISLLPETAALSLRGQRPGVPLRIQALLRNLPQEAAVRLFYRAGSASSFVALPMSDVGDGVFAAEVPAAAVEAPELAYYIAVSSAAGSSSLPASDPALRPLSIGVLPNLPPRITHAPVRSAAVGQGVEIRARIEDSSNFIAAASLFYRSIGQPAFIEIEQNFAATGIDFVASIPAAAVGARGLEYYLVAQDDFGVRSQYGTAGQPLRIFIGEQPQGSQSEIVNGSIEVFADKFTDPAGSEDGVLRIASGNVRLARVGGEAILAYSGALRIDHAAQTITALGQGELSALGIRLGERQLNLSLWQGDWLLRALPVEPALELIGGEPGLQLAGLALQMDPASTRFIVLGDALELRGATLPFLPLFSRALRPAAVEPHLALESIVLSRAADMGTRLIDIDVSARGAAGLLGEHFDSQGRLALAWSPWALADVSLQLDLFAPDLKLAGRLVNLDPEGLVRFQAEAMMDVASLAPMLERMAIATRAPRGQGLQIAPEAPLGAQIYEAALAISELLPDARPEFAGSALLRLDDPTQIVGRAERLLGNARVLEMLGHLRADHCGGVDISGSALFMNQPLDQMQAYFADGRLALSGRLRIADLLQGDLNLAATAGPQEVEFNGQWQGQLSVPMQQPLLGGLQLPAAKADVHLRLCAAQASCAGVQRFLIQAHHYQMRPVFELDLSKPARPQLRLSSWRQQQLIKPVVGAEQVLMQEFTLADAAQEMLVVVRGSQGLPQFDLLLPDGRRLQPESSRPLIGPTDPGADALGQVYLDHPTRHEAYYALREPVAGEYQLEVANAGELGALTVEILLPDVAPELELGSFGGDQLWDGASPIRIAYRLTDPDSVARAALYIDADGTGADGMRIAEGLVETDNGSVDWLPPADLPSGEYFLYAKAEDGASLPVVRYADARILIQNPAAPAPPTDLAVTEAGGLMSLRWSPPAADGICGYRVLLMTPDGRQHRFSLPRQAHFNLDSLTAGQNYLLRVVAVGANGLASLPSAPLEFTPASAADTGAPDLRVKPGSLQLSSATDGSGVLHFGIENTAQFAAFDARVRCFYGEISAPALIQSQRTGSVAGAGELELQCQLPAELLVQPAQTLFVLIDRVTLTELNTGNNSALITNTLGPAPAVRAGDDAATTDAGRSVPIDVLFNDADPGGAPLQVQGFSQPAHGTVSRLGRVLLYTPQSDYAGEDSFVYTALASTGNQGEGRVTIRVNPVDGSATQEDDGYFGLGRTSPALLLFLLLWRLGRSLRSGRRGAAAP